MDPRGSSPPGLPFRKLNHTSGSSEINLKILHAAGNCEGQNSFKVKGLIERTSICEQRRCCPASCEAWGESSWAPTGGTKTQRASWRPLFFSRTTNKLKDSATIPFSG